MAGLTAFSFSNSNISALAATDKNATRGVFASDIRMELIVFCIIVIVLALIVTVGIDVKKDADTHVAAMADDFKRFLSSISEYIGTYLMVCWGLKLKRLRLNVRRRATRGCRRSV